MGRVTGTGAHGDGQLVPGPCARLPCKTVSPGMGDLGMVDRIGLGINLWKRISSIRALLPTDTP